MIIEENLKNNEKLIFDCAKKINFSSLESFNSPAETYKSYCIDKTKNTNYYQQRFDTFLLKMVDRLNFDDNNELKNILSNKKIFNVFYFKVWGDVIEHKDPTGKYLGYPVDNYNSLLMPIKIPNSSNFKTFYGGKSVEIEEGKFMKWDVCNVPHYWKYDSNGELFELLHIDYIE